MLKPLGNAPAWAVPTLRSVPIPFKSACARIAAASRARNFEFAGKEEQRLAKERRVAVARKGGIARAQKLSTEQMREIGRKAAVIRLAKSTPEQRSAQARRAAIACNKKRWGD